MCTCGCMAVWHRFWVGACEKCGRCSRWVNARPGALSELDEQTKHDPDVM